VLVVLAASVCVTGCGSDPMEGASSNRAATPTAASDVGEQPVDPARGDFGALARKAMAESRIHSPVGDSAVDYYLALRGQRPDDAGVAAALAELSPYMVIATEQAIGQGDVYEAERLLALLLRMDAEVPAAPRLREALQALHQARQTGMARSVEEPVAVAVATASPAPSVATPAPAPEIAAAPAMEPAAATMAKLPPPKTPSTTPSKPTAPVIPQLLRDVAPEYPLHALRRGIEGRVRVAFTIEADGSVSAARAVASAPQGVFDEVAVAAARRWRFEPGAAAVSTSRELNFNLPGS